MSWFKRKAEELHHDDPFREIVLALATLEATMLLDFSKLQADVAAQGNLISTLAAEVATLNSSGNQTTIDGIDASVVANNAALTALLTPVSTTAASS